MPNAKWHCARHLRLVAPPLVGRLLHEWVTTVDRKRLGILYILYALVFLVIGGIEATIAFG